jgi:threonine/homoserine/homoserine lactone efflux protein
VLSATLEIREHRIAAGNILRLAGKVDNFWAFLAISILVIVTPGPDTAMTIRNVLIGGRRGGLYTALGISSGQMVWAVATSIGIVAILLASDRVFHLLKIAGAAYLVCLGAASLCSALRRTPAGPPENDEKRATRLSPTAAFRQGLISDLSNPKMAIFFASILPQFVPEGQGMLSALVLFGLVFSVLTFLWLSFYSVLIASAGSFLRRQSVRRVFEGVMGATLVALGIRVAVEQR